MSCKQTEVWMMDAFDGKLTGAEHQRLIVHLEMCAHCRADWEALSSLDAVLVNPSITFPAPGFVDRVEARLDHFEAQRRTLVGGLILLGAAAALCLLAVPSLLNGHNPLEAYGAFLQSVYQLLGHVAQLSYQLISAFWLVLNALARSADIPLANLLAYAAAIVLATAVWQRTWTTRGARVQTRQNGY